MKFGRLISRENEKLTRIGHEDGLGLNPTGNTYIKYKRNSYDGIIKMYNSKGDLVGIDIKRETPTEKEVIYNKEKGTTIVIIKDDKGNKFKGVANCMVTDVYNPQIGYDIAHYRASIKMNEHKIKQLTK